MANRWVKSGWCSHEIKRYLLLGRKVMTNLVKSLSHVWLFSTPWTLAYQASLSIGFSRQEYWSRLPFPSPEDIPNPGIEPRSPSLQADILPSVVNKGPSGQGYGFSSGHVWSESWTVKRAEHQRIDAFELWCWRRLLRVPWPARRSNQSILKDFSPGCSLEGLMLKLKL